MYATQNKANGAASSLASGNTFHAVNYTSINDALDQFSNAMAARGLLADDIVADGRLHRCNVIGKRKGNDAGAYILHLDGIPAGGFENHTDGLGWEKWRTDSRYSFTDDERRAYAERLKAKQALQDKETKRLQVEAQRKAIAIWSKSTPAPADHAYLVRKGIKPHIAKIHHSGALLIPVSNAQREIVSMQFIGEDGAKRFLTGGTIAGCWATIGKIEPEIHILIAEGSATAASLHEHTGKSCVIAFNAGNLEAVAVTFRKLYPNLKITICADADDVGKLKGFNAALASKSGFIYPKFDDNQSAEFIAKHGKPPTDYNDLIQLGGAV